jgi:pseudouridine-5'-phosphate glycosidase/pseudouridine kinase
LIAHYRTRGSTREYTAPVGPGTTLSSLPLSTEIPRLQADIIVAGALAIDYSCDFAPLASQSSPHSPHSPQLHTSNPSIISQSLGGVAHNVAKAVHYCGGKVSLLSVVGDDLPGRVAIQQLEDEGMQTSGIKCMVSGRSAQYVAVNDTNKDLVVAMADMNILEHAKDFMPDWNAQLAVARPKWFVADANWDSPILQSWYKTAKSHGAQTAFEPVSTAKSARLFAATDMEIPVFPNHLVDIASPNSLELASMHAAARSAGILERQDWWTVVDALGIPSFGARSRFQEASSSALTDQGIPQQSVQLLPFIPCILTKLGSKGVLLTMLLRKGDERLSSPRTAPYIIARTGIEDEKNEVGGVYMRLFPPAEVVEDVDIISVNGVGDTCLGALIANLVRSGKSVDEVVGFAQRAAVLTLKSKQAVSEDLRRLIDMR